MEFGEQKPYTPKVFIKDSTFVNGLAQIGGAIAVRGNFDVTVHGCKFEYNRVYVYGGAIFVSTNTSATLQVTGSPGKRSRFERNIAGSYGSNIYFLGERNIPYMIIGFGVVNETEVPYVSLEADDPYPIIEAEYKL